MALIKNILQFLWRNRIWWLIPVIVPFVLFIVVLVFAGSSSFGPFIYTITNF